MLIRQSSRSILLLFQSDGVGCLAFFLAYDICVNLRGSDTAVGQHLWYYIYVDTQRDKERSKRMAKTVERELSLNACCLDPFLEWLLCHWAAEAFEDKPFTTLTTISQSLFTYRQSGLYRRVLPITLAIFGQKKRRSNWTPWLLFQLIVTCL